MFDFLSSPCVLSYDHSTSLRRGPWVCRTVKGTEALLCYVARQQETHTALHKLCSTLPGFTSELCHLKILKVWTDKSFHPVALVPSFVPYRIAAGLTKLIYLMCSVLYLVSRAMCVDSSDCYL